jgi:hypothetical protein
MSAERVKDCWRRVTNRLASINSCESTFTISEDCALTFFKMHADGGEGITMTGEKTKLLLATLPFVLEGAFTPEVHHFYLMGH